MKNYEFALHHDNGEIIIRTRARNIAIAMEIICKAENCPQSAIKWWRIIPTKSQIKKTQNIMRGI